MTPAPAPSRPLPRRALKWLVKFGASAAMIALAWRAAGTRLQTALEHFEPAALAMAFLALNVGQAAAALRLRYTLARLGRRTEFWPVFRAHFIGLWFNQALPTGIGGDVAKVLTLRARGDLLRYARAVLLTRIVGLVALLVSGVLLTPFYGILTARHKPLYAVAAASSAALVAFAVILRVAASRRLARSLPRPARFLILLARDLRRFSTGRVLWEQIATSAVIVVSIAFCFGLIAQSLGHELPLWTCLVVVPPVIVSMHLPMSYAGWGTREVGAVVILPLAGVPAATALTISLLYGVLLLGSGLIGLALWFVSGARR
jgi:uncharacterized membrane protein YbhN (UPF0104 family)